VDAVRSALVIGGGIAGPAAALALAKVGVRPAVYEAHSGPADDVGAMVSVAPNGLDALRTLGVDPPGQPVPATVFADGAGHQVARLDGEPGLPATRILARGALSRLLIDHVAAAGIVVEYGKRLVSAVTSDDGVTARFGDGSTAQADILVGADGIHSAVRPVIDPHAPGPVYDGVLGFGATTTAGPENVQPGVMHFAFGRVFLGYWKLPDGHIGWFAGLPHADALSWAEIATGPRHQWLAELRAAYTGHVPGEALLARTDPSELVVTGPTERMPPVRHWHRGRLALVGDAVHAPSSSSGQGVSLAVESALELARCLRDLTGPAEALAAYTAARRARVEAVSAAAAGANRAKAGHATRGPAQPDFTTLHHHHIDFDAPVRP
jgi:2-polyprenyl-6-methoxyphenol hydroxylase-like FAD-dependent oxidoreductase